MKKIWMKDGEIWDGSYIVLDGMQVFNPSINQMLEAGYTEFVPPEPTPEELLENAKGSKIFEIEEYDKSANVNSFSLNGHEMWLSVDERQQLATQITANEAAGREAMTRWFGGQSFTYPLSVWKQMLMAVEVYAGDALNVTEGHKAAVNALTTVAAVEGYDYTTGYPEKLEF